MRDSVARHGSGFAADTELRVGGRRDNPPANASPEWTHTVQPFLDQCGAVLQFSCNAPVGSPCRAGGGECALITWITEDDPFFWYDGPRTVLRNGPIEFVDGDPGLRWRYQRSGHPIRDGTQSASTPINPTTERSTTHV